MKRTLYLLLLVCLTLGYLHAQNNEKIAIVEYIEGNSKTKIHHSKGVDKILHLFLDEREATNVVEYSGAGYRVQVFSSNEQRTAKNKAQEIEKSLRFTFPSHGVHRIYSSPFWKVRIGDFRTQGEARAFMEAVKAAFPEYSRETYVVRESKVSIK